VGCFDLSSAGIEAITDPTGLFLDAHHGFTPGTAVSVAMEGRRPLLAEVQALVALSPAERPRRTTSGVEGSRVAMILAVLQQHARIRLHGHDVFVSTVGGARLSGSASDTAVALAIASAHAGRPLGRDVAAIGELGLSGQLRRVPDLPQRLAEAARLGFKAAIVPADSAASAGSSRIVDGMRVMEIDHIHAALRLVKLVEQPEPTGPRALPDPPRW